MLRQNERGHGVAQRCDDAGNDQQQRPKNRIQRPQEALGKAGAEPVKLGEQVVELGVPAVVLLQQELGIPQLQNTADDKGGEA